MRKEEKNVVRENEIKKVIEANGRRIQELKSVPLGLLLDQLGDRLFAIEDYLEDGLDETIDLVVDAVWIWEAVIEHLKKENGRAGLVERTSVNHCIKQLSHELEVSEKLFGRDTLSVKTVETKLVELMSRIEGMV